MLNASGAGTNPVVFMSTVSCPVDSCDGQISVPVMLNSVVFAPTAADANTYEDASAKSAVCPTCQTNVCITSTLTTKAKVG